MAKPLHILILEDNPCDAELVQVELQEAGLVFTAKVVMTEEGFVRELQAFSPDLILSDYDLPQYNGALALAEARRWLPDTPFILVTGAVSEDRAIEILTQGAKDYVLKTRLQQRLVPAVRRALAEAEEQRARKQAEAELREAHRTLERQVEERTAALQKSKTLYSSLFDNMLDGFAYCRMIYDQGRPQDFIYLDVNRSFESLTGLKNVVGKRVSEVIPNIQESDAELIEAYGRVALTGNPERFEWYLKALQIWFSISVYSPEKDYFVNVFDVITARKQAEDALRLHEERLRLSLASSRQGWFDLDIPSGSVTVSPEYARMIGYDPGEFHTSLQGWIESIHPEDRDGVLKVFHECIDTGSTGSMEYRRRTKAGEWLWICSTGKVVEFDSERKPLRMTGTHADVTDRKLVEQELRESESRLQSILDNSSTIMFLKDLEGHYITVNRRYEELFKVTRQTVIGKSDHDLFPREYADRFREQDLLALKKDRPLQVEESVPLDDGLHTYISVKFPLFNTDGTPYALCGIATDITERKQAEESIRQSEELIRNILDTVDENFIVIDRDYRISMANKAYCEQLSLDCNDIIGRHCYGITHSVSRPCYEKGEECAVREAFETGKPHTAFHKHPGPDGQVIHVETKAFPIKDASGNVTSVIETINNITEKLLLEEERLKTQKLESIGTLAGGIAHDFNNLLQGIFGYIAMARLTFDQREKSLAMLEQAEKALQQSVNLTTQLLTFSKGGKPIKKSLALRPIIENAVKFALSGSRTDPQIEIDPDLWPVNGDAGQLGQVIQNIVLNADQAMPLGGVVNISARNKAAGEMAPPSSLTKGNYVELVIKDKGVGIPQQYLDKIFDPYFTTKEKGSGLGLATSYSIIMNHDGLIQVTSEVGEGTAFSIYVPAIIEISKREETGHTAPIALKKKRYLVMDDEEMIRSLLVEQLQELGNEVEVAAHGEATLAMYKEAATAGKPFDVVILDLTIRGGMGGLETVQKLVEMNPAVEALVSSGYSDDPVIANYREYGFKGFLKKPYGIHDLQNVLNALSAK